MATEPPSSCTTGVGVVSTGAGATACARAGSGSGAPACRRPPPAAGWTFLVGAYSSSADGADRCASGAGCAVLGSYPADGAGTGAATGAAGGAETGAGTGAGTGGGGVLRRPRLRSISSSATGGSQSRESSSPSPLEYRCGASSDWIWAGVSRRSGAGRMQALTSGARSGARPDRSGDSRSSMNTVSTGLAPWYGACPVAA